MLLPTTTANLDHSPLNVVGEKVKGAGYTRCGSGLHTIAYFITGFVGTVTIQASIIANPSESDWADIVQIENLDETSPIDVNNMQSIEGNYVWLRAVVTNMTYGTISKIQISY